MGDQAQGKRLRVNGYVEHGSIVRNGAEVSFVLHQTPGMLRDDPVHSRLSTAESIRCPTLSRTTRRRWPTASLGQDGVFHASKVQAKCASKYEAKPQLKTDAIPRQHLAIFALRSED